MARFLKTQTQISEIEFPSWAKHWINLRKAYTAFYGCGTRVNLQRMLDDLGMTFQGRPHCGLDDARNIAAIAIRLLKDGCVFRFNERYYDESCKFLTDLVRPKSSSPPKSRSSRSSQTVKHRSASQQQEFVVQEGENLEDLLLYSKLQKD